MWKKLREKQRNRQECTTAAAVVRILGGKFLEVHNILQKTFFEPLWEVPRKNRKLMFLRYYTIKIRNNPMKNTFKYNIIQ